MTLRMVDLIATYRAEMFDTVEPYLWSDQLIIGYAGEAQERIAEDAFCFTGVFTVDVNPGDGSVVLPDEILRIRKARVVDQHGEIDINVVENPTGTRLTYDSWCTGAITRRLTIGIDNQGGAENAVFHPVPSDPLQLELDCYRRPSCPPTTKADCLELHRSYKRAVMWYMRAQGRLIEDVEAFNYADSATYMNLFAAELERLKEVRGKQVRSYQPVRPNTDYDY